jgi:DNA-binding response OmpR family regulator
VDILFLTDTDAGKTADIPAALDLLPHFVRTAPRTVLTLDAHRPDVILLDARSNLADVRSNSARLHSTGLSAPMLAVMAESGLAALSTTWAVDGVVLASAGPAELDARLRLAVGSHTADGAATGTIRAGDLIIDPDTISAQLDGRSLALTLKEFELLKLMARQPDKVFTRSQLAHDIWGTDHRPGTRTIDVHVRRLRVKLGTDHEWMIMTVPRVGYKLITEPARVS